LISLHSILRPLGALMTSLLRQTGRATTWLPWLGAALVVAAVLAPGTVTASLLVFQSSPVATPVPPTPTPAPPPPPTPTPPPPTQPTATPVQPTPVPPTQAPAPPSQATPTPIQPTQPVPADSITPTMPPTPVTLPALTPTPLPPPPMPTPIPTSGANQPIVNWVKFWDTIAVTIAYPWLCCGVALLLMVPVGLLFLEIMGRRPPPSPPEPLPEEKGDEE
jgi:hypothetical protein